MTQEKKDKFIEDVINFGIAICDSDGNPIDPESKLGKEILAEFYENKDEV